MGRANKLDSRKGRLEITRDPTLPRWVKMHVQLIDQHNPGSLSQHVWQRPIESRLGILWNQVIILRHCLDGDIGHKR